MLDLLQRGGNETFRLIEREPRCGYWSWDLRTNEMEWSRGFFDLLGIEPGKLTPSFPAILQVTHPDDRRAQAEVEQIIREASSIRRKFRAIWPGGRIVWIVCQIIVLVNPDGAAENALGICSDITALEDSLKPLRTADERYRALVKASGGMVWVARADGKVHEVLNRENFKGESSEALLDSRWIELVHPDDKEKTARAWADAMRQKCSFEIAHRLRQPDGTYKWQRSQGGPIFDDSGNVKELLGINVDIEQRAVRSDAPDASRITGAQIRAARGLLRWSVMDLAKASGVSRSAIRRLEEVDGAPANQEPALALIQAAIVGGGVQLFFSEAGKPGVRPS